MVNKKADENSTKRQVRKYLKSLNEGLWFPYVPFMGLRGMTDILGCFRGKFIAIESKASYRKTEKDGGCSPIQLFIHRLIRKAGGHVIVAYSGEDVKKYFEENLL